MPLYEYECSKCKRRFEVLQKFSDSPLALCTHCGGAVTRLISSPAIRFKGTGWYVTDYGRKTAAGPDTKGDGKDGAEKDKPAAPSETAKPSKEASATSAEKSVSG